MNLHYETWPIHSEKTTSAITVNNNHIYFQAFVVNTTGDYTNVKFRCYDNTLSGNLNSVGASKILAGVYESGHLPPTGAGESPWANNIGGPGMPWPKNKIAEGSKSAFINVGDGHWLDIPFNSSVTLTRNKLYFLAFKAGEDPDATATWQSTWYGINDVGEEEKMSTVWIRDTDLGNNIWDTLPSLSYGYDPTPDQYYPPTHNDECLWFTVYGPQTTSGASKGITGQKGESGDKGEDGNDGIKGEDGITNTFYENYNIESESATEVLVDPSSNPGSNMYGIRTIWSDLFSTILRTYYRILYSYKS